MLETSAAGNQAPLTVDARGLRCPWPVLRLARAARDGGDRFLLLADDPATASELAAFVRDRGWNAAPAGENAYLVDCGGRSAPA